ncbi:unnamed protein product [Rotaria magnacalcarata]|uniref:Phage tail collar domain-containing protein n=1 Tax=Rotaria magnacalcarata TaxID=392030 RepID=A0A816NEC9_9BILA|nr:unnamed protein product [Rotaria magnacalcarata]CAF3944304.1 unnamed protein product [Rotaria magnacalcarata]
MAYSDETKLSIKLYDQIWSSSDLNPDRITSEINKVFRYNETETKRHNYSDQYFDLDKQHVQSSASSGGGSAGFSFLGFGGSLGGSGATSSSSSNHLLTTSQSIFSSTEIQYILNQESVEIEWTGEKLQPRTFKVYRLTDISDRLQVAIISKQLIADKVNGAIVRSVSTLNSAPTPTRPVVFLTGTLLPYSGDTLSVPLPWLFCDGSNVSRIIYKQLFSVLGVRYGVGDGKTTFNIPDFRGRVPLGVDKLEKRVTGATQPGSVGGQALQQLTTKQLPSHRHDTGSLTIVSAGAHTHRVTDPGHNHGGKTATGGIPWASTMAGGGVWSIRANAHSQVVYHDHTIARDYTHLLINSDGVHSHGLQGETGAVGTGQHFSTMPPYQAINYIIYTD